jgi:hypothetical protein
MYVYGEFEILTVVTVMIITFQDVTLCSFVESFQCFGGTFCFNFHVVPSVLKVEPRGSCKTLVTINQLTHCYISGDSTHHSLYSNSSKDRRFVNCHEDFKHGSIVWTQTIARLIIMVTKEKYEICLYCAFI